MIRIVVLSFIMFFSTNLIMSQETAETTEKLKWLSIEEAVELQKTEPRKIFIDVYTDWCGWCKRMDAVTFSHPLIIKYLNEKYYAVKLNAEFKEPIVFQGITFENQNPGANRHAHDLAAALLQGKMGYPSVVFIDEESNVMTSVPGFKQPADLEPILYFFLHNLHLTTTWEDFQKEFKSEIK